ncbi:carbohydrate ABC transporter permease [Kitasatospora sp. NPDC057015]|uniref:carbohydrate ABC transporter permease n=1 Tax=Kitasatospora sp. NPDC057015 TaxID=3346001 RepID=UPI00362F6DD0
MTATLTSRRPSVATRIAVGSARRRKAFEWIAVHSLALTAAVFFTAPLVFLLLTSLMTDQQALSTDLWPRHWQWSNYAEVFRKDGFLTWWRNSLEYSVLATAATVVASVPIAYALAKFRFRGRNAALVAVIAMMMLPPQVVVVPMYLVWNQQLHLTGTLWPLIIPQLFGDAFSIFLLRQFLITIPDSYLDAARVDGCGKLATLLRVVLPMSRPAVAAVALFQFFYCWNDYFGPQVYASENPGAWTLSYGLASFQGAHHSNWNLTMAATLLVMAPVVIIFFFAQKAFIEGATMTGVKG